MHNVLIEIVIKTDVIRYYLLPNSNALKQALLDTMVMRLTICWLNSPCRVDKSSPLKTGVLAMILNCIKSWSCSSGNLNSMEYLLSLLPSPLWLKVLLTVMVPSMDQIGLLKIIHIQSDCAKNKLTWLKNVNLNVQCMQFSNP